MLAPVGDLRHPRPGSAFLGREGLIVDGATDGPDPPRPPTPLPLSILLLSPEARRRRHFEVHVAAFEADIARSPDDPQSYLRMAMWWHGRREYAKALQKYDQAIEMAPFLSDALRDRACLRATCPSSQFRDGPEAVRDASAALAMAREHGHLDSDWRSRRFFQTVAAAYAEVGDFPRAITLQREALWYAITKMAKSQVLERLATLKQGLPIRLYHGPFA